MRKTSTHFHLFIHFHINMFFHISSQICAVMWVRILSISPTNFPICARVFHKSEIQIFSALRSHAFARFINRRRRRFPPATPAPALTTKTYSYCCRAAQYAKQYFVCLNKNTPTYISKTYSNDIVQCGGRRHSIQSAYPVRTVMGDIDGFGAIWCRFSGYTLYNCAALFVQKCFPTGTGQFHQSRLRRIHSVCCRCETSLRGLFACVSMFYIYVYYKCGQYIVCVYIFMGYIFSLNQWRLHVYFYGDK